MMNLRAWLGRGHRGVNPPAQEGPTRRRRREEWHLGRRLCRCRPDWGDRGSDPSTLGGEGQRRGQARRTAGCFFNSSPDEDLRRRSFAISTQVPLVRPLPSSGCPHLSLSLTLSTAPSSDQIMPLGRPSASASASLLLPLQVFPFS